MSCWTVNWTAIEAVAVTLTLAATLLAVELERRRHRSERNEVGLQRRREQAELIAAWCERPPASLIDEKLDQRLHPWWVVVQNNSAQPVYNVVLYRVVDDLAVDPLRRYDLAAVLHVLPPGMWYFDSRPAEFPNLPAPPIETSFSDKGGLHWMRHLGGSLEELEATRLHDYNLEQAELPILRPYSR